MVYLKRNKLIESHFHSPPDCRIGLRNHLYFTAKKLQNIANVKFWSIFFNSSFKNKYELILSHHKKILENR